MIDVETNCFGTIDKENSVIMSPNYPKEYPHDLNCSWLLSVPLGERVLLHLENFTTYDDNDFMMIYDGADSESNVIASLSGNFSQDISSTGSKILLRFITTKKNEIFGGFRIRYEGKYTI